MEINKETNDRKKRKLKIPVNFKDNEKTIDTPDKSASKFNHSLENIGSNLAKRTKDHSDRTHFNII